jgi:membrane protein DedA with SNARE-associated domain
MDSSSVAEMNPLEEPDLQHLTAFIHELIIHFGYPGLFLVMALGNMGMPAGTEVVVPTAGALAEQGHFGSAGVIPAWLLVALVATLGEIVGGSLLYAVGYYGGLPFVRRYGKYVMFREHELDRVHAFYERHGKLTVFWCRFIPFVRGVAAFPAGLSRMQKRYFVTYTAIGSVIFCFGLSYLGQVAGANIDGIIAYVHDFALIIIAGVIVLAGGAFVWWRIVKGRDPQKDIAA